MVCDSGAPANTVRKNGAAILLMKHFYHAPIEAWPAMLMPMAEPRAEMPKTSAVPKDPISIVMLLFVNYSLKG